MSLATFSKELKLFDIEKDCTLSASLLLYEEREDLGRISWSGDGNWFAVTPSSSRLSSLPIIRLKESQLVPFKHVSINAQVRSATFFSCTNRYIALGTDNGEIIIWDIKDKKVTTKLEKKTNKCNEIIHKSNADFLSLNTEDKYLASASLDDDYIFLHGLKTNKVIDTFQPFPTERVSGLCFCTTKKNYLAASSLESTICVWDIMKSEYIFKCVKCHTGACTDIAFSPVNYSVIGSVGLTKNLKMYDWREKKSILESGLGEPLTCMDFTAGGDKVVAGTRNGSVIVYDLRSSEIIQKFKAHNDPVLCIKSHPMKVPKTYDDVDINTPDVVETRDKTLDISVIDILSPVNLPKKRNSINSSHGTSFHSTPRFLEPSDSGAGNDSFLSKIISPVSTARKGTNSSPVARPSPMSDFFLSPIVRPSNDSPFSSQLPQIKEESPSTLVDDKCQGDGITNGVSNVYLNDFAKDILKELQSIRNDQKEYFQKLSNDISAVNKKCSTLEKKHELLEAKLEEIYGATVQFRVDHVCQRILTNKLNDELVECYDSITEELKSHALRLNSIHQTIVDAFHQ